MINTSLEPVFTLIVVKNKQLLFRFFLICVFLSFDQDYSQHYQVARLLLMTIITPRS